ncbi:hypothetical protein [Escherichia coli]|uniref:hypothetical protein n=1 Tax=Escherichia coli TaxID=562 RepID=UPI0033484E60
MSGVKINLSDKGHYLLFRAIVCEVLTKAGFKGDAWAFSDLDMSFEEIRDQSVNSWAKAIRKDMEDYKRDCPEDFA